MDSEPYSHLLVKLNFVGCPAGVHGVPRLPAPASDSLKGPLALLSDPSSPDVGGPHPRHHPWESPARLVGSMFPL